MSLEESKISQLSHLSPRRHYGYDPSVLPNNPSPAKTFPNESQTESISLLYKPVVHILRFIGVCPLRIRRIDDERISYSFKLLSAVFVGNFAFSLVVILSYMTWLHRASPLMYVLKPDSPENQTIVTSEEENYVDTNYCSKSLLMALLRKILPMQLPINTSINIIASLVSIPKFADLLDIWSQFENTFQSKFKVSKSPFSAVKKSRNKLALFYCLFSCVYATLVIFVTRPKCTLEAEECPWWVYFVRGLVVVPYVTYTFLEDFKYLLMFRTVEEGFRQVSIKIKEYNLQAMESEQPEVSLDETVSKWQDLLSHLRQQIRIVSKCSTFHHVVSLSTTFFSLLVGVYFSVIFQFSSSFDKNEKRGIAIAAMGFCIVGFSRCLIKTNGCERILDEEREASNQLTAVKTGDDFKTQIKINALIDLMGREPAQITILNSFKLNTAFLFQIIGQIATYLIVFLQFDKM